MTAEVTAVGRFSSQMLTYLGTQKTVKTVTTGPHNTFKYAQGDTFFVEPSKVELIDGVVGSMDATTFYSTRAYFTSRGASLAYAETMAALAIDISKFLNTPIRTFLDNLSKEGQILFSDEAYRAFNMLRSTSHQVGRATSIDNTLSFKARQIRP
jgi:hypothetical protein